MSEQRELKRRERRRKADNCYDYRKCPSLFGYGDPVHERSGWVCKLCDWAPVDVDSWRQLTVEHLIGESQHGYLRQIESLLADLFPDLSAERRKQLSGEIDTANTVTACHFCNSTTCRDQNSQSMPELLKQSSDPEEALRLTIAELGRIFERKRRDVQWKLGSVRREFRARIELRLLRARSSGGPSTGGRVVEAEGSPLPIRPTTLMPRPV